MLLLPYAPRPGQQELAQEIHAVQQHGGHLVAEAGTGTGKTVTALAASVATIATDGRRLVYATRTNSQQAQVVAEHGALQDAGAAQGLLLPFMGRRNYCPLLRSDERFKDGTAEELGRLCRDAKRKATQQVQSGQAVDGACPYYARLLVDGPEPVEALVASNLDGPTLARQVEAAGSCTYEALKLLMPRARGVVAPLVFVLDDRLRRALCDWMGVAPSECHLVVDEAHHLPEAARDHHSPELSLGTLTRAQREADEYQDPALAGLTLASSAVLAVMGALQDLADEYVRGEDGLVPPDGLHEALARRLRLPTPAIERVAAELERWGDIIREDRRAKGRLPRSYLGAVGSFLRAWTQSLEAPYVHLVAGGANPSLQLFLLDPASVLGWLGEFHSTTHMSGTLSPLGDHVAQCGLPSTTVQRVVPSPFPPENLRIYALEGVHRRFEAIQNDPDLALRQQALAREVLARCPGRTGLFFPSHDMLRDYLEEGFLHGVGRPTFVERPEASMVELGDLVRRFKSGPRDGLLLGVLGGRMSEGLDFPGDTMEHMLLFGVPYPKPSARNQALVHHYDRVAGNGWQVAIHNPVGRTMRQAIGRLIRGPDDRGTAVLLDDRAVRFHAHLPNLRMVPSPREIQAPGTPLGDVMAYQTADRLPRRSPPGSL